MKPIRQPGLNLPIVIRNGGLVVLGLILASYAIFQARFLIEGPTVTLSDLPEVVQKDRVISLRGIANNITAIYLNGRPIVTDEDGNFDESIVLENGYTIVSIDVVDLYGRQRHIEEPFVYLGSKNTSEGPLTLLEY